MKKITLFVGMFACFALIMPIHSYAQGVFSYHFGLAVPSSSFADYNIDSEKIGAAALGLNVGVKYDYPLSEDGLGLFAGFDLNYNGLQKGFRDDYENDYEPDDITYPKYLNIPVSGGLSYNFMVNDKVALFGKGGLVASFLKMTNLKDSYDGDEETIKFDSSTNLGYTIGVGARLNSKIELAITYMGLGEHRISYTFDGGYDNDRGSFKQEVGLTTLTIGFKF